MRSRWTQVRPFGLSLLLPTILGTLELRFVPSPNDRTRPGRYTRRAFSIEKFSTIRLNVAPEDALRARFKLVSANS